MSRNITKKSGTQSQVHEETQIRPLWKFFSKDQTQKVELTCNSLVVEFFKYSHFDEFRDSVECVYRSFRDIYQSIDLKRLGIRYINHIVLKKGNPFDWKNLVNPSLTHFVDNFFDDKKDMAKALSKITINKEDFGMNFLWGWHNTEFPSKIARREFILDCDLQFGVTKEDNSGSNRELRVSHQFLPNILFLPAFLASHVREGEHLKDLYRIKQDHINKTHWKLIKV